MLQLEDGRVLAQSNAIIRYLARDTWRVERGAAAQDLMEAHLSSYEWLVGDTLTIADTALYAYGRGGRLQPAVSPVGTGLDGPVRGPVASGAGRLTGIGQNIRAPW